MVVSIQEQLASLEIGEAPIIGSFNPKKGDLVLAQFSADNSWNRAMVRNVNFCYCVVVTYCECAMWSVV